MKKTLELLKLFKNTIKNCNPHITLSDDDKFRLHLKVNGTIYPFVFDDEDNFNKDASEIAKEIINILKENNIEFEAL